MMMHSWKWLIVWGLEIMTVFNIIVTVLTVIQIITCGFSFWLFLSLIGRLMFMARAIGIILKSKHSAIMEGVGVGTLMLWESLFSKDHMNWKAIIIYLVIGALIAGIEVLDDILFIYTTEDDHSLTEVTQNVQVYKRNKGRKHTKHGRTKNTTGKRKRSR